MDSLYRKILVVLEKELTFQENMIDLLAKERTYIVKLRHSDLENLLNEKRTLLEQTVANAKLRNQHIDELKKVLVDSGDIDKKELDSTKVSDLISFCTDSSLKDKLKSVIAELKEVSKNAHQMNSNNNELIKHSMGLVSSTIAMIHNAPELDLPVYVQTGKLTSDANKANPAKTSVRGVAVSKDA